MNPLEIQSRLTTLDAGGPPALPVKSLSGSSALADYDRVPDVIDATGNYSKSTTVDKLPSLQPLDHVEVGKHVPDRVA